MTIEVDAVAAPTALEAARPDDEPVRRSVALELHAEFPSVSLEQVTILVECLWSHFDGATVRDFVPLLVRKQAKEELVDHLGLGAATDRRRWARDAQHGQRATDPAL